MVQRVRDLLLLLFLAVGMYTPSLLSPSASLAQTNTPPTIDERINTAIAPVSDAITGFVFYSIDIDGTALPLIVVWLVIAATIFTVYMGFISIRGFRQSIRIVRGDYTDPDAAGEVSHFQALTAALSGTVGLGNIAGVAVAVSLGGPGATFWMIVAGILGMTTKFVECTLGVKYRKINADGSVSGGPMYYLKRGLAELGLQKTGKVLAIMFAVCCIGGSFGGGNMFQANQAFQQIEAATGGASGIFYERGWIFGLIMAALVALVILGGIKSIANVTSKLVPFMCGVYVLTAVVIILGNIGHVPEAFLIIIEGAFSPTAVEGGIIGVLIQGFRRAAFSNEAGVGSAAIAHSAVHTKEPVTEGFVALLEPFIDTVVVCTMTALVIVITDSYLIRDLDGVSLTSHAFATSFSWFPTILSIAVVLFAFSTMITWSYYGLKAWTYLFGDTRRSEVTYKTMFCTFTVIGSSMTLGKVIDFSDAMIFAMSLPNVIGLYILAPTVKRELKSYLARINSGEIKSSKAV